MAAHDRKVNNRPVKLCNCVQIENKRVSVFLAGAFSICRCMLGNKYFRFMHISVLQNVSSFVPLYYRQGKRNVIIANDLEIYLRIFDTHKN